MRRLEAEAAARECLALGCPRHGLVRRSDLCAAGIRLKAIERRVSSGKWRRLLPGIYAVAPAADEWKQRLRAATLWLGSSSAVSHRSAALLWKVIELEERPIELTAATGESKGDLQVSLTKHLNREHIALIDGIPVLDAWRMLLTLGERMSVTEVEAAVDRALLKQSTTIPRLQWAIEQFGRGVRGVAALRQVMAERPRGYVPPQSEAEIEFIRLAKEYGLPAPTRQFEVALASGSSAFIDFAYPTLKLGIEVDGYEFHSGKRAFVLDRQRQNQLTRLGWYLVRLVWDDVAKRRVAVATEILNDIVLCASRSASREAERMKLLAMERLANAA